MAKNKQDLDRQVKDLAKRLSTLESVVANHFKELSKQARETPPKEIEDWEIEDAWELISKVGKATVTYLQGNLTIGYVRASQIMDELEKRGIVSPHEEMKPRRVLKKYIEE